MTPEDVLERELGRLEQRAKTGTSRFWVQLRRARLPLIVLTLSTAFLQLRSLPEQFSNTTLDAAAILQASAEPKHVRLVTIDEQEYQIGFEGKSPLNPERLSALLNAIAKGNPAVIVVDIDTSHPMFRLLNPPVGVPVIWSVSSKNGLGAEGKKNGFEPAEPLGGTLPPSSIAALDLLPSDSHGVVRSYVREFKRKGGGYVPSLEFAASQTYLKKSVRPEKMDPKENEKLFDFRYRFYPLQARDVLTKAALPGWPKGTLNGTIVVVGGTFSEARDRYATPVRMMDGAEIVAQAIEADLQGTGISRADPWLAGALQMVAGLVIVVLYRTFSLRIALLASLLMIPVLSLGTSWILFHRFALWAALAPVLVSILVAELYSKATLYLSLCKKFSEIGSKPEAEASSRETLRGS